MARAGGGLVAFTAIIQIRREPPAIGLGARHVYAYRDAEPKRRPARDDLSSSFCSASGPDAGGGLSLHKHRAVTGYARATAALLVSEALASARSRGLNRETACSPHVGGPPQRPARKISRQSHQFCPRPEHITRVRSLSEKAACNISVISPWDQRQGNCAVSGMSGSVVAARTK
jgi:hypothetical protein